MDSVIQLKCYCNNYPWGKVGKDSLAAQLCAQTPDTDFKIEDGTNYAEMWMGTYPTTPAYVLKTGQLLQDVLNANKLKLIGTTVLSKFGTDLPFLPKILSMQKALPLQLHPDIELSKKLHKQDPEQFGDTNHKPEIAVALTQFQAFAGFKERHVIQMLLELDALKHFNPNQGLWSNDTMREICKAMLTASEDNVASTLKKLGDTSKGALGNQAYILDLIPELIDQYGPEDNGALVALILMNYYSFQPGEALFVPQGGIHAWFKGDIVECMARSDNVLNTGFCPRVDRNSIDTFVHALNFELHDSKKPLLPRSRCHHTSTGRSFMFHPPMSEFDMMVTELKNGEDDSLKAVPGPSIMFMTSGAGTMTTGGKQQDISAGYIYFIGQGVEVAYKSSSDDFVVYRAYAE